MNSSVFNLSTVSSNDPVAMYNLALGYIYEEQEEESINESIKVLIVILKKLKRNFQIFL